MATKRSSLRDELLEEKRKKCPFEALLKSMPDDLRGEVVDVLLDHQFSTASVVRSLVKRGYKADRHHINECRNGCACGFFPTPDEQDSSDDIR